MPIFNTVPENFLHEIINLLQSLSIKLADAQIKYSEEYAKDTGVWERYTLKEHTILVLNQFSKYDIYDDAVFPTWADQKSFRIMLALHDIGKPYAIAKGNVRDQGIYNKIFVNDIMQKLGISDAKLYAEITSDDTLGKYIKGRISLHEAMKIIGEHANNCGCSVSRFYQLSKIYFMCDAGAYTLDSGGKESLDYLFIFDRSGRRLSFSPKVKAKTAVLDAEIAKVSN